MKQRGKSEEKDLKILLILNCIFLIAHMYVWDASLEYFCQLTVMGQIFVILNFYLSIFLHGDKAKLQTQLFLSRFHLITFSLEVIVVIGFWGLRIFFPKGIMQENEQRNFIAEALSLYMHGGSFLTMFYFIKKDQILTETNLTKKYLFHLLWGVPFVFLQTAKWYFTGSHVYGFISEFTWIQLIIFEGALYFVAVYFDYFISLKHGYNILKSHEQCSSRSQVHIKIN